jgi:glutathione S-transferase
VLYESATGLSVPESSIIIEYLCERYPGAVPLIPREPERARVTRFYDRLFDQYLHEPMQKIVGDRIRPPGTNDAYGVQLAQTQIEKFYTMLEAEMGTKEWCIGDEFTMADCAAAPALYYANLVWPLRDAHKNVNAYLERLHARPAFARVLREAQPYLHMFPPSARPG